MNSLRNRAVNGAFWSIGGTAITQLLRLGGNLILTRLLFPEVFGLMALVGALTLGVAMLSDIGINASIIQNKRSDQDFLNTAWTLQVIRGLVLWIIICLISWPAADFYDEPLLMPLLIVSGFTSVIMGFRSTKLISANRKVELKRLTITEVTSAIVGLVIMVIGAWLMNSVWALVIGGLAASAVKVFMSFSYFKGENNNFHWDADAAKSIYIFGRWLMLSSMLTFLASQGDRLVIGRLFDVGFLGVYSIAIALVAAMYMMSQKLGSAVFFPSYSEIVRERPERLYAVLRKSRVSQIALLWPVALILVIWGSEIVSFLYDDRYSEAGWILEILSFGALIGVIRGSYTGVLMALGKTGVVTVLLGAQVVINLSAMLIGNYLAGPTGVIYGLAFVSAILYPIDAFIYSRYSLWQPEVDVPAIIFSLITVFIYIS